MQLKHLSSLAPPAQLGAGGALSRVAALAWSPNGVRLAVALSSDRYVALYDEAGEQRDRFPTKPAEKGGPRNYTVTALAFSPCSTRLAVAQSDGIVYVYKLGASFGEKKSICNKFPLPAGDAPTALVWPSQRASELVIGCRSGRVQVGVTKKNRASPLMDSNESPVVALAPSPQGDGFAVAHADGSLLRYSFPCPDGQFAASYAAVATCSYAPTALAWSAAGDDGGSIFAAGASRRVEAFSTRGQLAQQWEMADDARVKEFQCAAAHPSGGTVVLGNFCALYTLAWDEARGRWKKTPGATRVPDLYGVTAIQWRPDGSRLTTGSSAGAVDQFDACLRRARLRGGAFEVTYTSLSSIIVRRAATGARVAVTSQFGRELGRLAVHADRYLVAHTAETLVVADLDGGRLSEIPWSGSGRERFVFDYPAVCVVCNEGELSVVEYGRNEVLGSCRTEHSSAHLLSVAAPPPGGNAGAAGQQQQQQQQQEQPRKIAYLLDKQTVAVLDLRTGLSEATVSHGSRVDWLELNPSGTRLLFRDRSRALHLYDLAAQRRTTLLEYCNYVQWVPQSDVVVAQSRRSLCVWYSVDSPDRVTTTAIRGDVEQIERSGGRTEVVVDEGTHQATYALDETLIAFGTAADAGRLAEAVSILEALSSGSGGAASADAAAGMWRRLSRLALDAGDLLVAQRCYSALGDAARAEYLGRAAAAADEGRQYEVRARLAVLDRQFRRAEAVYLEHGRADEAVLMYRRLHRWEDAARVSRARQSPQQQAALRADHLDYLVATRQEEVAGALKEEEGDHFAAIDLYVRGGFPARAAQTVLRQGMQGDRALVDRILGDLRRRRQHEKAGDFLERLGGREEEALAAYRQGHAFRAAVDLSRRRFPQEVVRLEEEWGDWLAGQKQMDAACIHYTEAGAHLKAIHAAIEAKQWGKARILEHLEPDVARPFYRRVAQHYEEVQQYEEAERHYLAGGLPDDAVRMYTQAGLWERAHKIAQTYMSAEEVGTLYVTQARRLESRGQFAEAERLYLAVGEADRAIAMHKKNRQYDDMVRLVAAHRKDLLPDTHLHLAEQFSGEGSLRQAEQHYVRAGEWLRAAAMYRDREQWDDALRVAKQGGGTDALKQFALALALSVSGDGWNRLRAPGAAGAGGGPESLAELAVAYATETGEFASAFHVAEQACRDRLPAVHLAYAMSLEDEGQFAQAEEEFVKADKPKEAIDMYLHDRDWMAASRVAETHLPSAMPDVFVAQARAAVEAGDMHGAEPLFLSAKRPELAIKVYRDARMFDDAQRMARTHAPPSVLREIEQDRAEFLRTGGVAGSGVGGQQQQQQQQQQHVNRPAAPVGYNPSSPASSPAAAAAAAAAGGGGSDASAARALEERRQYSQAIDAYLQLDGEEHWQRAADLAAESVPGRVNDVVAVVARRLMERGRHGHAAEMYLSVEAHRQAVDAFLAGGMHDKARLLATSQAPQLVAYVNKAAERAAIESGNPQAVGELNPDAALEMYANRGEWERVYELAASKKGGGEPVVQHFATLHARSLVKEGRAAEALHVLAERGVAPAPAHCDLYLRLAQEVLGKAGPVTAGGGGDQARQVREMLELREVLYQVVDLLPDQRELAAHLDVAHAASMYHQHLRAGARRLAARAATALVRHARSVPMDVAVYQAGTALREAGAGSAAFVFLNRFVDLADAIAEGGGAADLDNSDFVGTDIPSPYDALVGDGSHFTEEEREEVREYVLDQAMSEDVDQSLPRRKCDRCSKPVYEGAVQCPECGDRAEVCVVTGYPVAPRAQAAKCKHCARSANRADWNEHVAESKTCPWCRKPAGPQY